MSTTTFFQALKSSFQAHANADNAAAMEQYMRNQFSFYGIKSPDRKALIKAVVQEEGFPKVEDWPALARRCFAQGEKRELQYAVGDLINPKKKHLDLEHLALTEELICTAPWWDTVDWLASHWAGAILLKHPDAMQEVSTAWINSNNMWLQRTAIIFQLKYKDKTRADLLYTHIEKVATSKEFFLQKAAGWALRQYAKFEPQSVKQFIDTHQLAPLTVREGMKSINKV